MDSVISRTGGTPHACWITSANKDPNKVSDMSLTVAPSASRSSASSLQPFYYASSLFVSPMRDDITSLLVAFVTAYSREPLEPERPFELFKTIWKDQGWDLVHLKVLDARARVVFLQIVMRLLLGTFAAFMRHL